MHANISSVAIKCCQYYLALLYDVYVSHMYTRTLTCVHVIIMRIYTHAQLHTHAQAHTKIQGT